jgi:hypothetical protein
VKSGPSKLSPWWKSFQQIGFEEMDSVGDRMELGVSLRYRQGCWRNVSGDEMGGGEFFRQRDSDAARAGAYVRDLQAFAGRFLRAVGAKVAEGEAVQGDFDEVFGFGAGNQNVGSDFEFEAPKFLFAGQVLRGLARGAAREQRREAMRVGVGDDFFRVRIKPGAVATEDVQEKQLRG